MLHIEFQETSSGIKVSSQFWEIEHQRSAGGAWSSLVFKNGSGKNLLRQPITSAIRFVKPDPKSESGIYTGFFEKYEKAPALRAEKSADGVVSVIAEGTYRDVDGRTIPVGFRRRTEYHNDGVVWTTLELMSESGCDDVIEVRAMDMALRPGMTDCFVRFHPTQAGGADLLGGRAWFDLKRDGITTPFLSRYTPLQIICMERGVEGIELFPGSELAQWDCAFKPDIGLGLYMVTQDPDGTTIEMDPYCLAFRRMKINVKGNIALKLGIGLPNIKPREKTGSTVFHASTNSRWASDDEIARIAASGVKLLRFHNDYRENGPFWHDGAYPPYDEAGMRELRRVIDTVHRHGMKIIPYVSLKELHPDTPAYQKHAREWMHMAAPSLDVVHTWIGSGEYGGLMCMKSGWLDFRKQSVETILSDLPWDGLYFDWTTFHPCCHPQHARGPYHTDTEEFIDFLRFCRKRVGEQGILFMHVSGVPSIVAENIADLIFIYEDQPGAYPLPGHFPPQCDFVPITPRQLVGEAHPGSEASRRFIMSSHLQGHPPATHVPPDGFAEDSLAEMALFKGLDLAACNFYRATDNKVQTDHAYIYASAWTRAGSVIIYAANLSPAEQHGALKFPLAADVLNSKATLKIEQRHSHDASISNTEARLEDLICGNGLAYRLPAWSSCVFVVTGDK